MTAREANSNFAFDKTLSYTFFLVTLFATGDEMRDEIK
jgi:hypothetical protein